MLIVCPKLFVCFSYTGSMNLQSVVYKYKQSARPTKIYTNANINKKGDLTTTIKKLNKIKYSHVNGTVDNLRYKVQFIRNDGTTVKFYDKFTMLFRHVI